MTEPNWVALGGGGVDYVGGWAAGTAYRAGDVVRHNGIEYLAVNPSTGQTPPAGAGLASGKELAYVERTTNFTAAIVTNNAVIGPTPAVTFDGVTPVEVEFYLPYQDLVSGGTGTYILIMDATSVGYLCTTKTQQMMIGRLRFTPSAGSHTFSVQLNASHVHTLYAGPSGVAAGYEPMFLRVSQVQPTAVAVRAFTAPGIGISLPASPVDGDEYILVDSLTAPTYQWHFRYMASITDAYKWVFVGGDGSTADFPQSDPTTSTTYTGFGPTVTAPRAGYYDIHFGAEMASSSGAPQCYASVVFSGAVAVDADAAVKENTAANMYGSANRRIRKLCAASAAVQVHVRVTAGTGLFRNRWVYLTPVRVA